MTDIEEYIIHEDSTCLEAIIKIDKSRSDQTLFVFNEKKEIIGSITDGDIRRGLISGLDLQSPISLFCNKKFYSITENFDYKSLRTFRKNGIKVLPKLNSKNGIEKIYNLKELRSILPLHAVIMAGGKGERLRPLTENTPKPLLKIGEKSIIDYNILRIQSYGIEYISITVNYLKDQIISHINFFNDKKIECIEEPNYLGTIGSLKLISSFKHDNILLLNSDIFTNIDLEAFYTQFVETKADIAVATISYPVDIPFGIFDLSEDQIIGIKEKPSFNYYANAGLYIISKNLLQLIPNNRPFHATDLISAALHKDYKVVQFPIEGLWIDIGSHIDYKKAKDLYKLYNEQL